MGGANYILNVSRVLRTWAPEIVPVMFASPDIDKGLAKRIEAATGAPALPLRDRGHGDDLRAMLGRDELESTEQFRAAGIDVLFESTGYYGKRPALPTLAWLHDFQHRGLPGFFTHRQWLTREIRNQLVLRNRTDVLLSSLAASDDLKRFYGTPKAEIHVVPFAVQLERQSNYAHGEAARKRLDLPERFIFFPGQFWAHKNHKLVIEALGQIAGEKPVVVAAGPTRDLRAPNLLSEMVDRIDQLGLWRNFRIMGSLPYADILALASRADAILNPSQFEGWSTTVEEAKALGTPLVLSNLQVHREQAGNIATFFDPHDPVDCGRALAAVPPRLRMPDSAASLVARNEAAQRQFAQSFGAALTRAWERWN
ncbi:glycosyltransferase family 1 protein [Sphingomonas oligophenolica]